MKDYFNYKDKICVVTGASSGIGKATAEVLTELGAIVYLLDIKPISIPNTTFISTDLSNKESIDAAFAKLPDHIDSFFGVAGLSGVKTNYYVTFTVNFIANKYITEEYLKKRMNQGATITYVTSAGGLHWEKYSKEFEDFIVANTWDEMLEVLHFQANEDTLGMMAYPLSKRAMNFYMAKTAVELGKAGIRVNALLPGSTDTGMTDEFEIEAGGNEELIAETGVAHRLATPEEMALPLIFLNSSMAGFISGLPLLVDYGNSALVNLKIKKDRLDMKVGSKLLNMSIFQSILKKQLSSAEEKQNSQENESAKDESKSTEIKENGKTTENNLVKEEKQSTDNNLLDDEIL